MEHLLVGHVGIVYLLGLVVFMKIVSSGSGKGADSSVNDRKLPIVLVVNLGCSWDDYGTCEHCSYLEFILVCKSSHKLLHREQLVRRIADCRAVCRVII